MPLGPDALMPAAVSIHCCERTATPLSAKARPGLRRTERISERIASRCGAINSRRRISTSNSRSRGVSSSMSASPPASTARSSSFTWAANIARVEPNSERSSASVRPAVSAISASPICSKGFSASSAISASMARSRSGLAAGGDVAGRGRFGACRFTSHGGSPDAGRCFLNLGSQAHQSKAIPPIPCHAWSRRRSPSPSADRYRRPPSARRAQPRSFRPAR